MEETFTNLKTKREIKGYQDKLVMTMTSKLDSKLRDISKSGVNNGANSNDIEVSEKRSVICFFNWPYIIAFT